MLNRNLKLIHYLVKKYPIHRVTVSSCRLKSSSSNQDNKYKKECPKDSSGRGFYYTLGGIVIGTAAVVAYAKYDEDFRKWLKENVPASDEFISFVTAEDGSYLEYIVKYMTAIKNMILDSIADLTGGQKSTDKLPPCDEDHKPYSPPKSAYKDYLEKSKKKEIQEKEQEEEKEKEKPPAAAKVQERSGYYTKEMPRAPPPPPPSETKEEDDAAKERQKARLNAIVTLEKEINDNAQIAITAYTDAICTLREYAAKVYKLVEESVENADPKVWDELRKSGAEKEASIKKAQENAKIAMENIEKMKRHLKDPDLIGDDDTKAKSKANIDKILAAVEETKNTFEQERGRFSITEKYWKKVQEARKHFGEELQILFPNARLNDRNMKLAGHELDLFILYAFQNILFYQKELSKLDMMTKQKLKQVLEKKDPKNRELLQAALETELDKEKRALGAEFEKKMLGLRAECEKDMSAQLQKQAEVHQYHMAEALDLKEKEVNRKLRREMEEEILDAKTEFKKELADLIGRLKAIDDVVMKRADQDKKAQEAQILWAACQGLESTLRASDPTLPATEQLRPLDKEVNAISNASASGDELVDSVVASLPKEAIERGVFTDSALRDRFLRVERVCRRVALLPEGGASMPVMLLSYLQSLLIIPNTISIPAHELANEPFDPSSLSTFDILQRARFFMDRGDFCQALRYMNLLEGAPRAVSRDWVNECRIYLEVQQASRALMTHAAANGLVYAASS